MKLLIAGSRGILDFDLSPYVSEKVDLIISGGADGIDSVAEKYADEHNIPKQIFLPEYVKYGKAAPIVRNRQMVDEADEVLVVWDGRSKGSLSTINYAKKKEKKLTVVQTIERD